MQRLSEKYSRHNHLLLGAGDALENGRLENSFQCVSKLFSLYLEESSNGLIC